MYHCKTTHITSLISMYTVRKKGTKAVTGAVPFQKVTLLYQKGAYCTMKVPICTL